MQVSQQNVSGKVGLRDNAERGMKCRGREDEKDADDCEIAVSHRRPCITVLIVIGA